MHPVASYWTSGASIFTNAWSEDGTFTGSHNGAKPVELKINGVSWSGLESSPCVLGGLERHDARDYLKQIRETMGFNAIRFPFAAGALVSALQPPICSDQALMSGFNKRYTKLSYIDQIAQLITDAADQGLL